MSKKHFIALADFIKTWNYRAAHGTYSFRFEQAHCLALADWCASMSPRFNKARWLGYIAGENGPSGGTVKVKSST